MGVHEFLRYSLSGYFFIGIIFIGVFFYPEILSTSILLKIIENQFITSILIVIIGYPLGFLFYSIHQAFYRRFEFIKYYKKEYDFLEDKFKEKHEGELKLDLDYLVGFHDIILVKKKGLKERIDYLSSLIHALGSILVAFVIGIVCIWWWYLPVYVKPLPDANLINFAVLNLVVYNIFVLALCYYRKTRLDLLHKIELIFVHKDFDEIDEIYTKYLQNETKTKSTSRKKK